MTHEYVIRCTRTGGINGYKSSLVKDGITRKVAVYSDEATAQKSAQSFLALHIHDHAAICYNVETKNR